MHIYKDSSQGIVADWVIMLRHLYKNDEVFAHPNNYEIRTRLSYAQALGEISRLFRTMELPEIFLNDDIRKIEFVLFNQKLNLFGGVYRYNQPTPIWHVVDNDGTIQNTFCSVYEFSYISYRSGYNVYFIESNLYQDREYLTFKIESIDQNRKIDNEVFYDFITLKEDR